MKDFHDHLVTIAHISEKHAPYYVGWVRQAYELAGRPLDKPLPPEVENESLVKLEHHREESPAGLGRGPCGQSRGHGSRFGAS